MNSLWKIVRPLMAIIGIILLICAVGTSDYYVLELGQPEPSGVWTTINIGFLMILPTLLHIIHKSVKER